MKAGNRDCARAACSAGSQKPLSAPFSLSSPQPPLSCLLLAIHTTPHQSREQLIEGRQRPHEKGGRNHGADLLWRFGRVIWSDLAFLPRRWCSDVACHGVATYPPPPTRCPRDAALATSNRSTVPTPPRKKKSSEERVRVPRSAMTVVDAESRFHVLAVDDSVIDRKLIEMLLKTSSYQVTTVDSGSKALELLGLTDEGEDSSSSPSSSSCSSSSPDHHQEIDVNLIITDYCMPGMTGYDLLKRVKGSSSLKDIPVVIMSSENVPARINRCLEDGAEEFFLKPVKLADMKKLKSHLLRRKQPQPQIQPEAELVEQLAALQPEEAAAEVSADDGTISDCNDSGVNKRKATAMEQVGLSSSPETAKPRLSNSSLAVET